MCLTMSNVIKISAKVNTSYQMKVGNVIKISAKVNTSYQMKVGGISFVKQIQKRARKLKKGVDK